MTEYLRMTVVGSDEHRTLRPYPLYLHSPEIVVNFTQLSTSALADPSPFKGQVPFYHKSFELCGKM